MTQSIILSWLVRWFEAIFPIRRAERKKVLLLISLKFLISFVYCILNGLKDTLLVTARHSAAEVIPIVKASIIFPLSIGVLLLYTALSNRCKQRNLFYGTVLLFLALMLLYGFVLYPYADKITPDVSADWLTRKLGTGYLHWIAVWRHWIHVFFFVVAEFWGQVVLMILYWSFVNHVCTLNDAKRLYAIFITAGNVALVISAPLIANYTHKYRHGDFLYTVQALIGYAAVTCVAIIFIYWWSCYTITPFNQRSQHNAPQRSDKKLTLSLLQSLKHVVSSKYLGYIAIMMISCGLAMNMVEGTWKSYLKEVYSKSSDYQKFKSMCDFWIGIVSSFCSFFISGSILRRFGWKITAQIAPIVVGVIGCCLFFMSYTKHHFPLVSRIFAVSALHIALFGGIHAVMAKAIKYTFFDKTMQIAYIPLDPESKIKGKAAVDLLGSRLGKAGSSWIQILLLLLFQTNNIQYISGVLFLLLAITSIFWYRSIHYVDQQLTMLEGKAATPLSDLA